MNEKNSVAVARRRGSTRRTQKDVIESRFNLSFVCCICCIPLLIFVFSFIIFVVWNNWRVQKVFEVLLI